jgi:hypothetical protein
LLFCYFDFSQLEICPVRSLYPVLLLLNTGHRADLGVYLMDLWSFGDGPEQKFLTDT